MSSLEVKEERRSIVKRALREIEQNYKFGLGYTFLSEKDKGHSIWEIVGLNSRGNGEITLKTRLCLGCIGK